MNTKDKFTLNITNNTNKNIYKNFKDIRYLPLIAKSMSTYIKYAIGNFETKPEKTQKYVKISHQKLKANITEFEINNLLPIWLIKHNIICKKNCIYLEIDKNSLYEYRNPINPYSITIYTLVCKTLFLYNKEKTFIELLENILKKHSDNFSNIDLLAINHLKNNINFLLLRPNYSFLYEYSLTDIFYKLNYKYIINNNKNIFNENNIYYDIQPFKRYCIGITDRKELILGKNNDCKDYIQAFFFNKYTNKKKIPGFFKHNGIHIHPLYIFLNDILLINEKTKQNILDFFNSKEHPININIEIDKNIILLPTEKIEKIPYILSMFGTFLRVSPFFEKKKYKTIKNFFNKIVAIANNNSLLNRKDALAMQSIYVTDYFNKKIYEDSWSKLNYKNAPTAGFISFKG